MSSSPKTVNTTSTTTAQIPQFLQPFLTNAAGTASQSLTDLTGMLQGAGADQLVAPITDEQRQLYQQFAAGGAEGIKKLTGIAGGRAVRDINSLFQNVYGQEVGPAVAQTTPTQNATLADLTQGNFIGTPGFQANVDASLRAAQPYIFSGFGKGGGVGAIKGGLAQTAMQQAASDSFARLYGEERGRQLQAATATEQAKIQREQIAAEMANQAAARRQQEKLSTLGLLGDLGNSERARQLQTAGLLAGGTLDIASQLQQQRQQQLTAPMSAMERLLALSSGSIPGNVIGQSTVGSQPYTKNTIGGILGGATAGAGIASALSLTNPQTAAAIIGGGLLGAF